jgi:hypothetical protein
MISLDDLRTGVWWFDVLVWGIGISAIGRAIGRVIGWCWDRWGRRVRGQLQFRWPGGVE